MKEYYSFQMAHGWNKGIVKKANGGVSPTIDKSIEFQHILLIEGIKNVKQDNRIR